MKFSKRTNWNFTPNQISQTLDRLKKDKIDFIDLTESNPTQCQFNYLNKKLLKNFQNKENLSYDPCAQGLKEAREAISCFYAKRKLCVNPEHILLTSSTSEAYSYLFRLLADQDDQILFPRPSYPLFQFLTEINDVTMSQYSLVYGQSWSINFKELCKNIKENTRGVVLVNPNNPTGSYVSIDEIDRLNKICIEKNIPIISDEVFHDFNFDDFLEKTSLIGNHKVLTFVLGGLSKSLGLPQMKLSWIVVNGPTKDVENAILRLDMLMDTFLSVNYPVQRSLSDWLSNSEEIEQEIKLRIRKNREFLQNQLKSVKGCELLQADGGWSATISLLSSRSEEDWVMKLLNSYHVLVYPGYFFDFQNEGKFVISLLPYPDIFSEGIQRVLSRIEQEVS